MKNCRFNENLRHDHLVAYIDLLGWSDKLLSANTYTDIAPLLNILKIFHGDFDLDYVKRLTPHERENIGEQIEILSDALVVTLSLNSGNAHCNGQYEEIRLKFWDIALAQAQCVVDGIFVRGGVSLGYCVKGDGVLLSDALVKSYKLESSVTYPIVAVSDELYEYWRRLPFYDEEEAALYTTAGTREDGAKFRFLDYISVMLGILQGDSCEMSEVEFLARHKAAIINEINNVRSSNNDDKEKVLNKYEWLKRYHDWHARKYGCEFCFDPEA